MGIYINPPTMTKEQFLRENGAIIRPEDAKAILAEGKAMPVCLVDNGPFTAAAIGYCDAEIDAFQHADDRRDKMWFSVNRAHLMPYFPVEWREDMPATRMGG